MRGSIVQREDNKRVVELCHNNTRPRVIQRAAASESDRRRRRIVVVIASGARGRRCQEAATQQQVRIAGRRSDDRDGVADVGDDGDADGDE